MMDNSQVATLETREHIVQCAEELFAAQGYRGISMREIAEATGLAKASIYHHFASKKEIYLQVLERDALVLRDTLEQAATQGKTARERIASVVTAYLELFSSKRNLIQLTLREIAGLETEIRQLVARYRAEVLHPLEAIIQEGVARGELRPLDSRLAALSLLGMLSIFITHQLLVGELELGQEVISHTVELFLDGAVRH